MSASGHGALSMLFLFLWGPLVVLGEWSLGLIILVAAAGIGVNRLSLYVWDRLNEQFELRVTVIDPRGNGVTRRLSVADLWDGHATARFPLRFERLPWGRTEAVPGRLAAEPGAFEVRVMSLSGIPVDRTTYEVERAPPVIVAGPFVDADASGQFGPAAAGTACEPFQSVGIEGAIIGGAIENPGELPAVPELFLHPEPPSDAEGRTLLESSLAGDSGELPPGETSCPAIGLNTDEVDQLRKSGGNGCLDLRIRGESVDRARVELPAAANETAASERDDVDR